MYRRILVPFDGSNAAHEGLAQALRLAKDQQARVRVLNVVDDITASAMIEVYAAAEIARVVAASRREGRQALKAAAGLAAKAHVSTQTRQVEGHGSAVSDMILREAKRWRPDLIVMGTHGRRGLNRLLLGSDAERVLRETPAPLLLVRAGDLPKSAGKTRRGTLRGLKGFAR